MLATTISFVGVNIIVHFIGTSIPTVQNAFVRFAWGWLFLAPAILALRHRRFPPRVWGLFGLRGAVHAIAVILWFYAMARVPMADVTAIGYLNPIVVTIGGALLLGEGFAWRRGLAIAIALIGGLIILRPGLREIEPGHIAQLGAALFFGIAYIVAKGLTRFASPGDIVAMMTVTVTLVLAPFAIAVWVPLTWAQVGWIGLTAAFATLGHYCMTRAFACAPVTVTQPVTFLQLVWASMAGWLLFGETVDPYVILGGGLIITAVSYMTWREAATRRQITPVVPATKV
ncbi:DMT family transporter [Sinirhodobacter populi]|uniref:DMT family transporter n=2 Tax=Paenirhodobacter populi TaxID=2306993 RepID=A0A443K875_9RHOB|nr:DMT family transporter [Sinirhodobacter populi]